MRLKNVEDLSCIQNGNDADPVHGFALAISSCIDTLLNWNDIRWFRSITKMALVLKSVQSVEATLKAMKYGVEEVVLLIMEHANSIQFKHQLRFWPNSIPSLSKEDCWGRSRFSSMVVSKEVVKYPRRSALALRALVFVVRFYMPCQREMKMVSTRQSKS